MSLVDNGENMPLEMNPGGKWEELDILTAPGQLALKRGEEIPFKVGQVLKFDFEGSITMFKIMRLDRRTGKVWAKETKLYTPEELSQMTEKHYPRQVRRARSKRGGA